MNLIQNKGKIIILWIIGLCIKISPKASIAIPWLHWKVTESYPVVEKLGPGVGTPKNISFHKLPAR